VQRFAAIVVQRFAALVVQRLAALVRQANEDVLVAMSSSNRSLATVSFLLCLVVPMDNTREIKARLGAAKLVLEDMEAGSSTHRAMSSLQSKAFCKMISGTPLPPDACSDLAALAVQTKWHGHEDLTAVLTALTPATSLPPGKRRRCQQNFMNLVNYGTAAFWAELADSSVPSSAKLHSIMTLALGTGLRCPTEHTVKWLTSWWMCVSESPDQLARWEVAQKACMLTHVKHTFDTCRKVSADPLQWLEKLPENPVVFLRDHPEMYKAYFGSDTAPVPAAVDLKAISAVDMSYSCRGGAPKGGRPSSSSGQAYPPSSVAVLQVPGQDTSVERMASAFMSRMEVMANNQQRMLELVMGQCSGSGSGGVPRALAAIMNNSPATRRMPNMQFEEVQPPATPRTDGVGMLALQLNSPEPESPPAKWADQSSLGAMPLQFHGLAGASGDAAMPLQSHGLAGASGDAAIVLSGGAVASSSAIADLNSMLSILGERKVEKDAAKAMAKGGGKGKEKLEAEAGNAEAKGEGKGEGKGKAKAKAKAGAKGKGKCKAKAKAAPTILLAPPKAKAGAKAEAKAKAKNKAKAGAKAGAVVLKLGCSKCRGGVGGCAQCRNPDFAGLRWSVDDM
jgi:hypothetical protein